MFLLISVPHRGKVVVLKQCLQFHTTGIAHSSAFDEFEALLASLDKLAVLKGILCEYSLEILDLFAVYGDAALYYVSARVASGFLQACLYEYCQNIDFAVLIKVLCRE